MGGATTHGPRRSERRSNDWAICLAVIVVAGLLAVIGVPQLLGAREKARNATVDNIYVALNGEVANELDGAVNGGTGNLGPVPVAANASSAERGSVAPAVTPVVTTPASVTPVVVYSGEMTFAALDVRRAASDAMRIAKRASGYVLRQDLTRGAEALTVAHLSLRVPAARFDDVLDEIARLGIVSSQTARAADETESQLDIDARLAAKQALEKRLLELLPRAGATLADALDVEKQLARVREEIETLTGQRAKLTSNARFSSLELEIDELSGAARGFRGRLAVRFQAARAALHAAADAAGRVAADLLLLAVPAGVAGAVIGWFRARVRRRERTP